MGDPDLVGPWFCGPEANRRAYVVDDIGGIEGGQGLVVRAERCTFDGDPVGRTGPASLKLLTDIQAERVETMRRRWACLADLDHPNLAAALEVFEGPGLSRTPAPSDAARDVCYAAATWIDGVGLREVAPLAPADAFRLATDLASALKALHGKGLIHRDLHPGNVIVDRTGRSVLIDFGSARHDDGSRTVTVSGVVGFIPPDCLHGQGNAASDRWGLGMLVVFALLGHPQGSTGLAQLERELHAALRGIGQPRRAVGLLRRMVDPDPGRRPDEMGRWADELADCLSRPRGRRRRLLAKVGVVGTAGICAGLLAWGSPHETAGTHTPVASVECREAGDGS